MYPDSEGKITVTNTMKHIMEFIPEIKMPDADIETIPLADLTLAEDNSKRCIAGYAEGKKWMGERYAEYEFTLVFG